MESFAPGIVRCDFWVALCIILNNKKIYVFDSSCTSWRTLNFSFLPPHLDMYNRVYLNDQIPLQIVLATKYLYQLYRSDLV